MPAVLRTVTAASYVTRPARAARCRASSRPTTTASTSLLAALAPGFDPAAVRPLLESVERIAAGDPAGGPTAALPASERFHRLVAPASTIVQPGPLHTGLADDPEGELGRLFARMVER